MTDNVTLNPGALGDTIAADDVGGAKYQRVKLSLGADGTAADAPVGGGVEAGSLRVTLASDSTGVVSVDDNGAALTVDNAGTFAVQATLAAETTKVIGTVNVAAAQTLATVTTVSAVTAITNALPTGTNAIGKLAANSGVDIGDVDVTSVIPGTGATNLGKAEDAAHTSGDTGVMGLAVRRDADTALVSADGDYAPLQVNAAGSLKVAITAGAGSGGTSIADGASFTRDTTSLTPVGGVVETSAPTLTAGDAVALSLTTAGALRVNVASGGVAAVVEDAAAAGAEEGIMMLAVRRDSASSGVSADGDFAALSVDSVGALRVTGGGGGTQYAEDAVHASGDSGTLALVVRKDTAAQVAGTDGDYSALVNDASGRLHVNVGALPASTNTLEIVGDVAHDAAASGNPVLVGAYASAAAPTDVSADADAVRLWALRSGALAVQPTLGGVLAVAGNGASGTGVPRVTLANDSTGIIASIGTSVVPGTGATHLGKAEDAAHTSGDTGVMSLAVRRDADTTLVDTTGDYAPLQVNAAGALKVAITSGAGSGGTSIADGASFTRDTTSVTLAAAAVETSAPTLTAGDAAALSMTTAGALRVNVASGGIAAAVEDAAAAGGEDGVMMLAVRRDSASSGVSADGDFAALSVTSDGSLRVAGSSGTTQYTEDGASAGAESLCLMGAVRRDTGASSSGTDGDYSTLNTDATGNLRVTTNTQYAEDAASAGGELMTLAGAIRADTANTTAGTNGDYTPLLTDANGRLHVISAFGSNQNIGTIGTSVTPGTSAAHLGKAEDAAHTSGDTGVMILSVRSNTAAATSGTDGDYQPLITDTNGRLHVITPSSLVDDAAFTPATSSVIVVGFEADETATDSVDEGDAGAARMTLDRKQIVTQYAHAAAGGSTPYQNLDVDETEDDVKTSPGKVFWLHAINLTAVKQYLKFYNDTAANVIVGTTTPVLTFPVPTTADTNGAGFTINFGDIGVQFSVAICIAATTGFAVADTGAPATNAVIVNLGYA